MTRIALHIRCALTAGAALALHGCGTERTPTEPLGGGLLAASGASAGDAGVLVVDDDGADCPRADFTSIQAAVLAARPGGKILVCRGVYREQVLVDKADLRIQAQATADEVVLQGTSAQRYGFHLRNTTGVLLDGFRVQGFADANIIIDGGSGNTLRRNVTTAGVVDGIELLSSSANTVEHNISFANAAANGDGLFVSQAGSTDNIIRHNETYENGQHGINLFQSGAGNVVFGNSSYENGGRGISIGQSNGTVSENNHVFANGTNPAIPGFGIGILVMSSTGVTVKGNRVKYNRANGIALNASSGNVVSNNRSDTNAVAGISLNGASNNLVERNEVSRNVQDGIRLQSNADNNVVQVNQVLGNWRDGIRVVDAASADNTIEGNVMRASFEHDAHDDSVGPGTAGTANFWLKNHCETESRAGLCAHFFRKRQ